MLILLMKTGNKTARNRVFYFNLSSFCYNLQLKMLFLKFFNSRLSIVNRVLDWHLSSMSEPY